MHLHSVTGTVPGHKTWCGPSAISIITGQPYFHALEMLKERRAVKRRSIREPVVKGTWTGEMLSVLRDLGYTTLPHTLRKRQTVARWLDERKPRDAFSVFLIAAANHWMVVRGDEACCGILKSPVYVGDMKFRSGVLTDVIEITLGNRTPAPIVPTPDVVTMPRATTKAREWTGAQKAYSAYLKLKRQHGFSHSFDRDGTLCWIKLTPFGNFPHGIETMHMDWWETLRRLETCLGDPSLVVQGNYSE